MIVSSTKPILLQELSLITKEKRKRNAPRKVKQQVDTTQDTPSSDEEEEEAVDDHMQEKAQTDMMSRFSMDQSTGHSKRKKVMKPEGIYISSKWL